ncbi:endo-1,4-beta-xylanase [Rufibacter quisquiliarum]|uniref:Beta-xylanase n=1 Tax=Rufibacter quisquiliarum TaxID=1549639 RepID=A0A839GCF5_9BACT|nr:endo-1,4-beta-xylanase [Rufibacter quisquiliarum]MBA9077264.1 endo-1,4-beta-xylanase [Rufibacter quisquiliarum]
MKLTKTLVAASLAAAVVVGCVTSNQNSPKAAGTSLKEVFKNDFLVGAALNYRQVMGQDPQAEAILAQHFSTISPENLLKWESVHPQPEQFNFGPADAYVALGQKYRQFIVGHALVWHQQTPRWVFENGQGQPASKEVLLKRIEEHITAVAGRYKGKINGWDVVNEALNDDGTLRQSKWHQITGEDYLAKAFETARNVDPKAELYYNDYNLWKPAKRNGAVKLVQSLKARGLKVDGIGMQGHYGLENPSLQQIEESILAFSKLGKVMITELDIDVLPNPSNRQGADIDATFEFDERYNVYTTGLPEEVQLKLTQRYADLFTLFHKHRDKISRVTFWGVTDKDSWLNDWPIKGRTSYPMVFDRNYQPKPALNAIVQAVRNK